MFTSARFTIPNEGDTTATSPRGERDSLVSDFVRRVRARHSRFKNLQFVVRQIGSLLNLVAFPTAKRESGLERLFQRTQNHGWARGFVHLYPNVLATSYTSSARSLSSGSVLMRSREEFQAPSESPSIALPSLWLHTLCPLKVSTQHIPSKGSYSSFFNSQSQPLVTRVSPSRG